jgi:hypothetical protein
VTQRILAPLICLVLALALGTAIAADTALTEGTLRAFAKGKTTLDEVTARLGAPARTATDAEGLTAIVYPTAAGGTDTDAAVALFGSIGKFASAALTEGPEVLNAAGFVFDREKRLVYYRAGIGKRLLTSEDGSGTMPNVVYDISAQQSAVSAQQNSGDRPHLGLQLVPTDGTGEQHRKDFDAAKFRGMIVVKVLPGSAAEKAGLQPQDYLYLLNGFLVASFDDVAHAMESINPGDTVRLHARRIDQSTNLVSEHVFDVKL